MSCRVPHVDSISTVTKFRISQKLENGGYPPVRYSAKKPFFRRQNNFFSRQNNDFSQQNNLFFQQNNLFSQQNNIILLFVV